MKGEDNFFLRSSSLKWHLPILKAKKAWIHRRKVLDSLCSLSFIFPFASDMPENIKISAENGSIGCSAAVFFSFTCNCRHFQSWFKKKIRSLLSKMRLLLRYQFFLSKVAYSPLSPLMCGMCPTSYLYKVEQLF